MACMGIIGAALFGVGDWLIYLYPGLALEKDITAIMGRNASLEICRICVVRNHRRHCYDVRSIQCICCDPK